MALRMTRGRWVMGAGAGVLLLAGGIAAGPVAILAGGDPNADLSRDEAVEIVLAEYPGTTATDAELEEENGIPVYEIALSNGLEVEVDGNSGQIIDSEAADDDDEQEDRVPAGTLDDGAELLPQASISLDQAITAAQGAAEGDIGEVDLEYVGDRLVFNVDIGSHDVKVDAADGSIVSVDSDD